MVRGGGVGAAEPDRSSDVHDRTGPNPIFGGIPPPFSRPPPSLNGNDREAPRRTWTAEMTAGHRQWRVRIGAAFETESARSPR